MNSETSRTAELQRENAELRARLEEAEETLNAIRGGEVDALVVGGQVYSLKGAETPYRLLIESMQEGAAILDPDSTLIYCNRRMAEMTGRPLDELIGTALRSVVPPPDRPAFDALLEQVRRGGSQGEIHFQAPSAAARPVNLSLSVLELSGARFVGVVATDLTAHRLAEDRVRASEERLGFVLAAAKIGDWDMDLRSNVARRSLRHDQCFGYRETVPTWGYDTFLAHVHPDDRPGVDASFRQAMTGEADYDVEFRSTWPDGSIHWLWSKGRFHLDETGQPVRVGGIVVDITERKETQEEIRQLNTELEARVAARTRELAESEERLRAVLEASATGSFEVDLQSGVGRWNDVEYALLGLEPGELPAGPETFFRFVHPGDVADLRARWEAATRGGTLDAEFRVVRGDGRVRWLAAKGHFTYETPATAGSNAPTPRTVQFLGVNFDITERKLAEAQLRASEVQYRLLFETTLQGVVYQDAAGKIISMNAAAVRILGKTPEEFLGQTSVDVEHDTIREDRTPFPGAEHPAMVALHTGREVREVVMGVFNPREWAYRWIRVNAMPLFRPGETTPGQVYTMFADITEQKSAADKIHELNAQLAARAAALEESNKELESFSYSVSHDLRAPLRALDGFSKIALSQAGELSPESREALHIVRDSAQQMGRLIDDLLMFSRMSRQAVRKQRVAPLALVQECLEILRPDIDGRHVEIVTGELPVCQADPGLLKLVWTNLLSNALKFTRPRDPARIEIGARVEAGTTVYFVRDNGVGFKMAYAEKLFGVFQRLHRAEDFEGTGVGLATVQRIVQRHGGRIWAEAELNRGATFFFTLEPAPSS